MKAVSSFSAKDYKEYEIIYNLENTHWWYLGLKKILFTFFDRYYESTYKINILDAGCGTGGLLKDLRKYDLSWGIDISEEALRFCRKRGLNRLSRASVTNIPFANETFDVIISLDVLYHLQVSKDTGALEEFYRTLKKGGRLFLNLPAYNFLRSGHDRIIHTRQRYTKKEVKKKLQEINFKIEKISYWNTILFPPILIIRLLKKKGKPKSDLRPVPYYINKLLIPIISLENKLLKKINFLFGLSIFCVARK